MRKYFIASLASLSLSTGVGAVAQEALWFTPTSPTVTASEPTPDELSFTRRFGGLLSQPKPRADALPTQPLPTQPQPEQTRAAQKGVVAATNSQPSGARDFQIPWSLTATAPFPLEQAATTAPTATANQANARRGAQVRAITPEVKPTYVQPAGKAAPPPVAMPLMVEAVAPKLTVPITDTVPWGPSLSEPKRIPAMPVAVTRPQSLPHSLTQSQTSSPYPALPQPKSQPQSQPPAEIVESLIQPVPEFKLNPSATKVELPLVDSNIPSMPLPSHASRAIPNSAPTHYVMVDAQQSPSDRVPGRSDLPAVVPVPPISASLSDRVDKKPEEGNAAAAQSVAQEAAAKQATKPETPLLTTESMIGPLRGAEQLFGRLELEQDLRHVASRIESGPRGDADNYTWMPAAYTWISPTFYHHPLYFEQPNLERYGLGTKPALQPFASSAHFFWSIPLIPYKTLTHHPREKVYTLGNQRPGNCVPVQRGVILGQSTVGEVTLFWEECSGYR